MGCDKYEKWISDSLDGEISAKRSRELDSHLAQCPSCRAYQERLRLLQQEVLHLESLDIPCRYWEEFSGKLASRLRTARPEEAGLKLGWRSWRWAWAGAAVFIALAFSLVLILRRGPQATESYIFSFEKCLDRVYGEIGDDTQLADLFNLAVVNSLGEDVETDSLVARPLFVEDPFFLESLSEEELEFLSREIEKEIKS
jgi:hypothetical protein